MERAEEERTEEERTEEERAEEERAEEERTEEEREKEEREKEERAEGSILSRAEMEVPMRTMVAPWRMARGQSWDIPMDSSVKSVS